MKTILAIISVLLLTSCCKSDLIETVRFSASELQVNPYSGNETLKFIDNDNVIVTYGNGNREISQQEIQECDGGCCDYYLVEMHDQTVYHSNYLTSDLQIIISNPFDKHTGEKGIPQIHFAWVYYASDPYLNMTSFSGLPVDLMEESVIELGMYADSLIIRDVVYTDIYIFPGMTTYPEKLHADTLYYSASEGIVGLHFSDGNLWTKL